MESQTSTARAGSSSIQDAQNALRQFWDHADTKYGERTFYGLDQQDRQRLIEIETHLLDALKVHAQKDISSCDQAV